MELDIETYAKLTVALTAGGTNRAEILAAHGLCEERWEEIDNLWQARFSEALDQADEGVPALVVSYAVAYEAAQRTLGPPISIEQFARATRLLQAGGDPQASIAKVGITMSDYVRASEHWNRRMAGDAQLASRFEAVLYGGDPGKPE